MRLRSVPRSATAAWSPHPQPLLALGTVAGALDVSFSAATELEVWDLGLDGGSASRMGGVSAQARFNRLAWTGGSGSGAQRLGVIAGGMENGDVTLWSAGAVADGASPGECLLLKSGAHSGAVKGLDFNATQPNLLATGSIDRELCIWDLNSPSKPYAPGGKSAKLEDITVVAWNRQVPYILASGSSNGACVIWDLRSRKELLMLTQPGGRKTVTGIAWNPDVVSTHYIFYYTI